MEEKELLDLETSFEEIKSLPLVSYIVLPINADLEKYKHEIDKLGTPIWIKLNTSEHKVHIEAIKQVCDFSDLTSEYKKLRKKFPEKKFIIQEHISGTELISGIKEDKVFGKVLLIGTGGHLAEEIKDTSSRILPVDKEDIISALKQLKIYKILKHEHNLDLLIKTIDKFSKLKIREADLNPIIVNKKQVKIVDARISI